MSSSVPRRPSFVVSHLIHADLRSRSLAPAIFRAGRDRREHPDRGQRFLAMVPGASLGLRQARGCAEPEACGRAAWHDAAAFSGFFQADRQSQGHGRRQPHTAFASRLRAALCARPFLDDAARRPSCFLRHRGSRRRAALVASCHRKAGGGGHVRLLDGACGVRRRHRGALRRMGAPASCRLYRHAQSGDDRRHPASSKCILRFADQVAC